MRVEMNDPATWPLPVLPLIRQTGGLFPECGVLPPGHGPVVYVVTVSVATRDALARCERHHYLNFSDLAGDGWVVD